MIYSTTTWTYTPIREIFWRNTVNCQVVCLKISHDMSIFGPLSSNRSQKNFQIFRLSVAFIWRFMITRGVRLALAAMPVLPCPACPERSRGQLAEGPMQFSAPLPRAVPIAASVLAFGLTSSDYDGDIIYLLAGLSNKAGFGDVLTLM